MSNIPLLLSLCLSALIGFVLPLTPLNYYFPQLIALLTLLLVLHLYFSPSHLNFGPLRLFLLATIVHLCLFATHGLQSPFYFLLYFLILLISFRHPPTTSLIYTVCLILFLSQTLNSIPSLLNLLSLLLITPFAWLISRQEQLFNLASTTISAQESDTNLWLSLKLKDKINRINSLCQQLVNTKPSKQQKNLLSQITDQTTSILTSASTLRQDLQDTSSTLPDDTP